MNLLFFSVELESGRSGNVAVHERNRAKPRQTRARFRRIAVTAGAIGCAAATAVIGWALAGGGSALVSEMPEWLPISTASASAPPGRDSQVDISSDPDNAMVLVDGHKQGQTPISLRVATGPHTLLLTHSAAVDYQRQITVASDKHLEIRLMQRRPNAIHLKSAYPGASISRADFLADGRLALSMAEPAQASTTSSRTLNAAWIFDPRSGSLSPFKDTANPRSVIVAVSPDGGEIAYARGNGSDTQTGSGQQHLTEVLLAGVDGSPPLAMLALPGANANSSRANELEEVHDIFWTPDGHHLLIAVRLYGVTGGTPTASRSRLLLVNVESAQQSREAPPELVTLPAEIVAGSYTWAADGGWVAFLTEAITASGGPSFVAVCAVDTRAAGAVSGFRYVADLGRQSAGVSPLPVASVAWSPAMDGRLVYVGPTPKLTVSNLLGLPTTSGGDPGLFTATPASPGLTAEEGQRLGSATGLIAPAWPSSDDTGDMDLIALARSGQGSKPLTMLRVELTTGVVRNLDIVLPAGVGGSGAASARWDLAHGQLLVLAPHDSSNSGLLDYWLVQLQAQTGPRP